MPSRSPSRLDSLLARLTDAIASRAGLVALAALLVSVGAALYAAGTLRVQVDTVKMFRADLPHLQRWFAFAERYPLMAEPLVVVVDSPEGAERAAGRLAEAMRGETDVFREVHAPGSDPFFRVHGLLYQSPDDLSALGDRLAGAQPLLAALDRDPTLRGLFEVLGTALEWSDRVPAAEMQPLLESIGAEVEAAKQERPAGSTLADALFGGAPSDRSKRALILALPRAGREGANPALPAIERIGVLSEALGLESDAGARVRVTGDLALSADELALLNQNALATGVVAFVLVTGVLLWGLRNARLAVVLCLTLAVGLLWTAAFAALTVGLLNMISVAFAVMSIGLGIDFGIHLGLRYRELAERGRPARVALRGAVRDTGTSLLWCSLTTAVGFYAFLPTDFSGLAEFGWISGSGILLSVVATLVVFPALIVVMQPRFPLRSSRRSALLERLLQPTGRSPRAVLAGAAVLTAVAAAAIPSLRFSGNPLDLRVPDSDSASAFRDLLDAEGDTTWNLQVIGRSPVEAQQLAAELEDLEVVGRATTLADLVPAEQDRKRELLEDIELVLGFVGSAHDADATPAERAEALSGFGEGLACEGGGDDVLVSEACALRASIRRLLASFEDESARDAVLARLERRLLDPVMERIDALERALVAEPVTLASLPQSITELWVAEDGTWRIDLAPAQPLDTDAALASFVNGVRARVPDVTGMAVNVVEADRMVVEALQVAFALAAFAIVVLLTAVWRSVADAARALIPIGMAAVWLLGGAAWLGMSLNFANVIVLPLVLGIGIDSGVHLVDRQRRHAQHTSPLGTSTPRAILLSCVTTLASFGSLALSSHPGMASMGRLLVIGVVCAVVANLVVLPALFALSEARVEPNPSVGEPRLANAPSAGSRR